MKRRKVTIIETKTIDEQTCSITVQTEASEDVVFLQALIESYEGLGTVRTEKSELSGLTVFTTTLLLPTCLELLENL